MNTLETHVSTRRDTPNKLACWRQHIFLKNKFPLKDTILEISTILCFCLDPWLVTSRAFLFAGNTTHNKRRIIRIHRLLSLQGLNRQSLCQNNSVHGESEIWQLRIPGLEVLVGRWSVYTQLLCRGLWRILQIPVLGPAILPCWVRSEVRTVQFTSVFLPV